MVLLDVVYLSMNRNKSYGNVILKLMEDIMREIELEGVDTSILHHVYLLLFTMFLCIIMLFGVILMPFLS